MVIPSKTSDARKAAQRILAELDKYEYADTSVFAVRLALEESLNNAMKHGNRCDSTKTIEISFDIDKDRASITITDEGEGFSPNSLPDPRADENLEKPSGRGIMLMRAYMDEVKFNERGNQVCMFKRNE